MRDQTELHAFVAAVAVRWQRQRVLRVAGAAAAVAGLPLFGAGLMDVVAAPAGAWLVALVLVALLAAIVGGTWVAWRARRRPAVRQVARFIEERAAALPGGHAADDGIVSAVEIGAAEDERGTAAFRPLILAAARRRVSDLSEGDIVTSGEMRSGLVRAVSGAAVLGVALVLAMPAVRRAVDTLRIRYFPASILITVTPGDVRIPAGSALRIRAALDGAGGRVKTVAPVLVVSAGGEQRAVAMAPAGEAFEYAFESVDRSFAYRIAAGRAQSADYRVTALYPPKVTAIDLRYEFPSFAGLPPREERGGGDIYGPAGTRVRVRVHTDKVVAAGALALSGAPAVTLRDAGERLLEADLVLRADGAYRVSLGDADGLRSLGDTEYFIRLMDDRPPDVRILRPSSDSEITPLEEVTIEARADDDYGISSFDLVYAVSGGPERTVRFDRVTGTDVQRVGVRLLAAEDLAVRPGDVVTYYARARDVGRGKRPTETRSDIYFLEVKPFAEEFVAAQSQAGGAAAAQMESLIEAQKEIISATWNIERRSQAGRSTEDVRAVATAQADLKARAEQMSGRSVRGRRGIVPQPQRIQPFPAGQALPARQAPAADPIGAAVEAMARAATELQDQKTKTAIPHEMTALNGLLQAQAEVRRRQVSQAAAGGGNAWGNRQGQDLSALFDKELQRQQRTNYESQTRVETRPDQPESPDRAADRVRDLARRQEDLNRRQRELADAGVTPAERRRQLEKLTRDQAELRQQVEQLARDLSGSKGGQSKGGQDSGQASAVRGASNDMRSASGELDRDDPRAAASSGERAAERLRRVEQGLRDGAPRAASQPAGDLQLEAQQIAQEQRRIAGEAERLRQQKAGSAEAARRLADEKDRLAGRVDRLRQSAEQQSAGPGAANLAEAVRAIDRERIGQRMRDSASRLRGNQDTAATSNPSAERDLAEAVERVADTLGGSASAETRRLSDELRDTRAVRDRLDSLEQRMREAGEPSSRGARTGGTGQASKGGDLQSLQQEYQRELERARQMLGSAQAGPRDGTGGAPEQHEFSRSAPGTERFKQDRSGWESLRREVDSAIEKREASVSDRLARVRAAERFAAGGSEHVPERYRRQVAKYYEALAKAR